MFTLPLLAYTSCGWVSLRVCRQRGRRWSFRRLAFCSSSPAGGGDDGAVPSSSLSGCRHSVVVVILILGTLFSSWRALAGAGYLLRGGMWSVVDIVGRCTHLHLVPFLFPPSRSRWLLQPLSLWPYVSEGKGRWWCGRKWLIFEALLVEFNRVNFVT